MAAFQVNVLGIPRPVDANGNPYPSGTLTFYQAGATSTPLTVYGEQGLSTDLGSTITANGDGLFVDMWVNADYRVVLKDKGGVVQWTRDVYSPLGTNTVTTAAISNTAVTLPKLVDLDDAKIIIGGTGTRSGTTANGQYALSGDVTMSNTGVVTIAAGAVETSMLEATVPGKFLVPGLKYGGTLSNNSSDAEHDIDITACLVADSTDSYYIQGSADTIQIDAVIADGTSGGFPSGLTSGAVQASTWYRVFIVAEADGSNPKYGFDTSATAANVIAACTSAFTGTYSLYRRIGWVLTDGSANIIAFEQYGDRFMWDTPIQDLNSSSAPATRTALTVTAPASTIALFVASQLYGAGDRYTLFSSANQADVTPSVDIHDLATGASGNVSQTWLEVLTNSSRQIYHRTSNTLANLDVYTKGWVDLFD